MNIITERLSLEPVVIDDCDELYKIFSDPMVMRYWSSPCWRSIEEAKDRVSRVVASVLNGESVSVVIRNIETRCVVGTCSFDNFCKISKRAEVGFCLSSSFWQLGYMREALTGLIEYGFNELKLNRIEADIDPRNENSISCVKKLGFQFEGLLRERWIINSEVSDSALFSLIYSDWCKKL